MESLYAQYLTERTNDKIIEMEEGFVSYRFVDKNAVYIVDIFVKPEFRKQGFASKLADCVAAEARKHGCTSLLGTVDPRTKGSTISLCVLVAYGMKVSHLHEGLIVFKKEI